MRKAISSIVLVIFALMLVGCPAHVAQPIDRYVGDAQKFVDKVEQEYPDIKVTVLAACDAGLITEENCTRFKDSLDPTISKSLALLSDALKLYQRASKDYQDAVEGSPESDEAWTKVSAAINSIISEIAEATKLYVSILDIYQTINSNATPEVDDDGDGE